MPINKQNSESENPNATSDNKMTADGGAFSTKQAKESTSTTDKAPSPFGDVGNTAKNASDKPQEKPPESVGAVTTEAIDQVKDKASSVLGEQKANLASGVASVADSIRQVGENLGKSNENNQIAALAGKYGDTLAGQVEKFSSYIEDKDYKELMRDIEQFARRNPALFVGGAFALGVLAARFLKSSSRGQTSGKRSPNNRSGNYAAGGNRKSNGV